MTTLEDKSVDENSHPFVTFDESVNKRMDTRRYLHITCTVANGKASTYSGIELLVPYLTGWEIRGGLFQHQVFMAVEDFEDYSDEDQRIFDWSNKAILDNEDYHVEPDYVIDRIGTENQNKVCIQIRLARNDNNDDFHIPELLRNRFNGFDDFLKDVQDEMPDTSSKYDEGVLSLDKIEIVHVLEETITTVQTRTTVMCRV